MVVVFDHDDGVSQLFQSVQGGDETPVIPLMQADTQLIEDIEDPE